MQINCPSGEADRLKKEEQKNAIVYSKVQIRLTLPVLEKCPTQKLKCPTHLLQMPNAKIRMPNAKYTIRFMLKKIL
jgi:hypothetical protein